MQCLPLNEGGTQSAGQRCYCVLCPPAQQHSLRFAEDTKDVCSSWPSTVGRVPEEVAKKNNITGCVEGVQ